jgi:formylglycine-generating enzyme required for sulfatase activity
VDEGVHAFAHQAFREYLAGTYLVNQGEARLIEEMLRHAPTPDEWWEQVLLLAGAHPELSSGAAGRLVEVLLEKDSLDYAHLAARCAQDMTDKLPGAGRKKLQDWLVAVMQNDARPAKDRARAGDGLALAGDPRPGVGLRPDGLPDLDGCLVPAGSFWMGTREGDIPALLKRLGGERAWYERESPRHEVTLPAYYVARYPVTVAQFRAFVRESGYQAKEPWERVSGLDNHPVVAVTWYDARAYCTWLTEQLRAWEGTPGPLAKLVRDQGWQVRLPTEAEWEKAARGSDGRIFPWGDEPDPERANYGDSGIGRTSAVGCFPGGASPYGMLDMSGNVWEWCHSLYQPYPYKQEDGREDSEAEGSRVLRGGAFYNLRRLVRCASRHWGDPGGGIGYGGFRICVAPGL